MKEIELTQGKVTLVDDEDYEELNKYKWCANHIGNQRWYALRHVWDHGANHTLLMHRVITSAPQGMHVDHINGDALDNTRANLRVCTCVDNCHNSPKHHDSLSPYKGIWWAKNEQKWVARIMNRGQTFHLGYHNTAEEAAIAYDRKAIELHGEFARTNFSVEVAQCA